MIIKTTIEQLREKKDFVWRVYQIAEHDANKARELSHKKSNSSFTSGSTKRLLKYEAEYRSDIAKIIWDYHEVIAEALAKEQAKDVDMA